VRRPGEGECAVGVPQRVVAGGKAKESLKTGRKASRRNRFSHARVRSTTQPMPAQTLTERVALGGRFAAVRGIGARGLPAPFGCHAAAVQADTAPIELAESARAKGAVRDECAAKRPSPAAPEAFASRSARTAAQYRLRHRRTCHPGRAASEVLLGTVNPNLLDLEQAALTVESAGISV
jgi:hypothetical protein